jgi:hypothetical protein
VELVLLVFDVGVVDPCNSSALAGGRTFLNTRSETSGLLYIRSTLMKATGRVASSTHRPTRFLLLEYLNRTSDILQPPPDLCTLLINTSCAILTYVLFYEIVADIIPPHRLFAKPIQLPVY